MADDGTLQTPILSVMGQPVAPADDQYPCLAASAQTEALSASAASQSENTFALSSALSVLQQNIGALQALVPLISQNTIGQNANPNATYQALHSHQQHAAASAGVASVISQLAMTTALLLPQLGLNHPATGIPHAVPQITPSIAQTMIPTFTTQIAAPQISPSVPPNFSPYFSPTPRNPCVSSSINPFLAISNMGQMLPSKLPEPNPSSYSIPEALSVNASLNTRATDNAHSFLNRTDENTYKYTERTETLFFPVSSAPSAAASTVPAVLSSPWQHFASTGSATVSPVAQDAPTVVASAKRKPFTLFGNDLFSLSGDKGKQNEAEEEGSNKRRAVTCLGDSVESDRDLAVKVQAEARDEGEPSEKEFLNAPDADDSGVVPGGKYQIVEMDPNEILAEHTHFCEICGKGFKRDANLRMHMRGHGDEYKTAAALARPAQNNSDANCLPKRYSCPNTGCKRNRAHPKFLPLKTILCVKNHYRRSHCPKLLSCSKCGAKKFSVVADLKTHEKHCGRDKWMCSCGTSFSRKDKLLGHLSLFTGHQPAFDLHLEGLGERGAGGGSGKGPSPIKREQIDLADDCISATADKGEVGSSDEAMSRPQPLKTVPWNPYPRSNNKTSINDKELLVGPALESSETEHVVFIERPVVIERLPASLHMRNRLSGGNLMALSVAADAAKSRDQSLHDKNSQEEGGSQGVDPLENNLVNNNNDNNNAPNTANNNNNNNMNLHSLAEKMAVGASPGPNSNYLSFWGPNRS